jgi:4-carboxymuconolactone decarboxylase
VSERHDRGWAQLTRVNGTDDPRVVRRIAELSPDLARMIVEFGYGDCYADRPMDVLDERQRQLVTLGALAATAGCEDQLAVHANVALNVGLTPDQVVEAVLHALPYVGFPRTLNAMEAVRGVLERRGEWPGEPS